MFSVSLAKLINGAVILAVNGISQSCVGPLINRAPHIIIKGIAIWGAKRWCGCRNFRTTKNGFSRYEFDMITSPVARCSVFDQPPSRSRSALSSPGTWYRLHVDCATMWEDKYQRNLTIASDHPNLNDVNWVFGFHQREYESVLRLTPKNIEIFAKELPSFPNFLRIEYWAWLYSPRTQCPTGSVYIPNAIEKGASGSPLTTIGQLT